jgi:hypothetical protein
MDPMSDDGGLAHRLGLAGDPLLVDESPQLYVLTITYGSSS